MLNFFKQLFCKHDYIEVSRAPFVTVFGVDLFSQWNIECKSCGKERIVDLKTSFKLCNKEQK